MTDRMSVNKDVEFEAGIFGCTMSRSLQNRHILKKQNREVHCINQQRVFDTFRFVEYLPVT